MLKEAGKDLKREFEVEAAVETKKTSQREETHNDPSYVFDFSYRKTALDPSSAEGTIPE